MVWHCVCVEYGIWVHCKEYPNIGMSGHVTMRLGQGDHKPNLHTAKY